MNKQMGTKMVALVLVSALGTAGCSTMFGRNHDEEMVTFDANVQGVDVLCSGKRTETPGSIPLLQSKSHSCTAKKEGYEKKAFRIRSGTSWSGFAHSTAVNTAIWGWWTLGIGTGIGWLVDWPSGAMRNLKEDNVYLEMRPEGISASPLASEGSATIVAAEKIQDATVATLPASVADGAKPAGIQGVAGSAKISPPKGAGVKVI